ncbi:MAG: hypothetical protein VE98_C0001G0560 [candidate division Kazan bacterium GW2011_GWA1_50_15]|uniref:Uncharacterized protein n=2 Tax=Bacteria division Kazan-3B-28 TaxID=1798534 RepID=A0A0G1X8A7_UNCK3|nr:MAG: hypothetical protein VE98_C0001G0560 [candidate division Kazan bacterium GW2011_GWA1_50_15]KKW25754.1 MAG: hypothetical protein VE99_C0001G0393 [candidate division Kazan bacterium GW2011_GWC1_52_13]KKW27231.1 MAG: hypothetical protein VF00_C0001G0166 [candidate division Kazan bacterium GW2011_GWB1_52_7]
MKNWSQLIKRFLDKPRGRLMLIVSLLAIAVLVGVPLIAHAQLIPGQYTSSSALFIPDWLKRLLDPSGGLQAVSWLAESTLKAIVGALVYGLEALLGMINALLLWILNEVILKGQNGVLGSPAVLQAWGAMRSAANVLFFLALAIFAIMIITRSGGYNFKKAITGLVTAVVLANLSYQLVWVFIEAGDALKNSASTVFGFQPSQIDILYQDLLTLFSGGVIFDPKMSIYGYIGLSLVILIIAIVTTYALFRIVAVMTERAIQIILLTIFAPFYFALGLLPHKDLSSYASRWWTNLIKWILVLPISFLLLGVANLLRPNAPGSSVSEQLVALFKFGDNSAAAGLDAGMIMYIIVMVAVMIAAANTPKMLDVPLSAATKWMGDMIDKPFQLAGKSASSTIGKYWQLGVEKLKGSKLGGPLRQAEIAGAKLDAQLEAAKKANKVATGRAVNEQLLPQANVILSNRQRKLDEFMAIEGYKRYGVTSIDDLDVAQKSALELQFDKQNPGLASSRNWANAIKNSIAKDDSELEDSIALGPEAMEASIADVRKRAEAERVATGRVSTDTARELSRKVTRALKQAGTGVDKYNWRKMLNPLLEDSDFYDLVSNLTTGAGYQYMPKKPFAISAKDEKRAADLEAKRTTLHSQRQLTAAETEIAQTNARLAASQTNIASLSAELGNLANSLNRLGGAGQQAALAIRSADPKVLDAIANDADFRDSVTNLGSSGIAALSAFSGTNKNVYGQIERIAANPNLDEAQKVHDIEGLLSFANFQGSADAAAKLLVHRNGIPLATIRTQGAPIAEGMANPALAAQLSEYATKTIGADAAKRQAAALAQQQATQQRTIDTLTVDILQSASGHPSYENTLTEVVKSGFVTTAGATVTGTAAQQEVRTESLGLMNELRRAGTAAGGDETKIKVESLGLGNKVADWAKRTNLTNFGVGKKDLQDPTQAGELSLADALDHLARGASATNNIKP